jgi:hypothetical protein
LTCKDELFSYFGVFNCLADLHNNNSYTCHCQPTQHVQALRVQVV